MSEMINTKENETALENKAKNNTEKEKSLTEHKLTKPISYNDATYETLHFDFNKLTGIDGVEVENELNSIGKIVISPVFSIDYIMRIAARACAEPVGVDFFEQLPISDFNKIRNGTRSFLLRSES